jgi:glycosyltransferase involved in cell wall biosynthesis
MSRILLIGRGPLPSPHEPQLGFSQLRTAAFLESLQNAGHSVRLALLVPAASAPKPTSQWEVTVPIQEEGPGWLDQLDQLRENADVIVGAGPYNPSRAACLIAQDTPVWADIPGDPFSELQALAIAMPEAIAPSQIAAAQAAAMTVLGRADAISVISRPQRFATLGQLGMAGRLLNVEATPPIQVLPITNNFGLTGAEPRTTKQGGPFILALAGAFNPWFDDLTLTTALDIALQRRTNLQVICTGGGVKGFYETGFNRFNDWAKRWPERVTVHGWLPHGELQTVLSTAHAGLSLDVAGSEPELGSRTRLLLFAHMGIIPISTVTCSLAEEMSAAKALVALPGSDPTAIANSICELKADPATAHRSQAYVREHFSIKQVMSPLCDWVLNPRRTQSATIPEATIAAELATHRDTLAQIYSSPTWQVLDRIRSLSGAAKDRFRDRSR